MKLARTVGVRKRLAQFAKASPDNAPAPSWVVIFAKAYAIVCRDFPSLRRSYLAMPWAHLYQHPHSLASIAIEKEIDGEPSVVFLRIGELIENRLTSLDSCLRQAREEPLKTCDRIAWQNRCIGCRLFCGVPFGGLA